MKQQVRAKRMPSSTRAYGESKHMPFHTVIAHSISASRSKMPSRREASASHNTAAAIAVVPAAVAPGTCSLLHLEP